ncbi:MAG: MFS transporter [Arenicellales bacterium]
MRWRILALLFLARIALGFQFQTMASVGDTVAHDFALDYAQIGFLVGLFMTPGLFLALPAGFSGSYLSDRGLVVLGLLVLAAGGLISGLGTDSWAIGLGRLVAGAGFLFATLYFTKMTADWFEGREIATAMSILVMSWPFGIAMGQIGYAWLTNAYGWRVPFEIASIYGALAAVGIFFFYRPPKDVPPVSSSAPMRLTGQEWRLIICAGSAWGVFNAGYVVYLTFGPTMLASLGHTAIGAASVISIGSWLMILAGTVCGQISDRFGRQNTILTVCMVAAVVSLVLLSLPSAGLEASLLFGILGMAPAGVIIALAGEAIRPERRAFGMGVFFTVYYAIMMAGPPIAGAILDATGRPSGPLLFGMALFAAVVPLALMFRYVKAARAVVTAKEVQIRRTGASGLELASHPRLSRQRN